MPDVPKHAWTHRPRSEGGTDPIVFPEMAAGTGNNSAFANSYPASIAHAGSTTLTFNELWRSDAQYTAHGGNEASYQYIDIADDGWYQADFTVYVGTNTFDPGDIPFIEAEAQVGGSGGNSLQSAVYPTWNLEQGWIGGEMSSADDYLHRQWYSRVLFNYVAADVDPSFGIGVNLESSGSETLLIGGFVTVTWLHAALVEIT